MLKQTIGIIPMSRVEASIGDRINKIMIEAIMIVKPRTRMETLVLRVS